MSHDLREVRLQKIEALRGRGVNPYPDRFARTHRLHEARALSEELALVPGEEPSPGLEEVKIAGRLVAYRPFGKLAFGVLQDADGRLQISLNQRTLGRDVFKAFAKDASIGDFVGVAGRLFATRKGEYTLNVEEYTILSKALRPMPEKWAGLKDQELRWRHRYLDLIANADTRARFRLRTQTIRTMRQILDESGFEEVETPVLVSHPSGALARPFTTHHNSLDIDVVLRIAPETYLKRLIVGGYDRVYEFARCFRNEGMDPSHLQDFTMLEWYASYWNFQDNMDFTEVLIKKTLADITGGLQLSFAGKETDFGGTWPRRTLREMIIEDAGIDIDEHGTADSLRAAMREREIRIELPTEELAKLGRGNLIDQLYKKVSRPLVTNPVFVTDHPADLSPLARRNDANPAIVDRFQLVVHGWELVNAYSELVDPVDQRRRLEEQSQARAAGDAEAMVLDEDYLQAMEYGMPPISGFGLGIDRFVALMSGQDNLREVVFFPLMRPQTGGGGGSVDAGADNVGDLADNEVPASAAGR